LQALLQANRGHAQHRGELESGRIGQRFEEEPQLGGVVVVERGVFGQREIAAAGEDVLERGYEGAGPFGQIGCREEGVQRGP
jgi:hypothetical protein